MTNLKPAIIASDTEIFNLIMASQKKLTETVLRRILNERNIFVSSSATREELADYISGLTFNARDLKQLLDAKGVINRAEKTTFTEIAEEVTDSEVRAIMTEYANEYIDDNAIEQKRPDRLLYFIDYTEMDFSRTTLLQRREQTAKIEFTRDKDNGNLIIRYPANEKSAEIIEYFHNSLQKMKNREVNRRFLDLSGLTGDQRNAFFLTVVQRISAVGYRLTNMSSIKVASEHWRGESSDEDEQDNTREIADQDVKNAIRSVVLNGENVAASKEFRNLRDNGFHIVSMIWESVAVGELQKYQFRLQFDDEKESGEFKYLVKIAEKGRKGSFPDYFRKLEDLAEKEMYALVEKTAQAVYEEVSGTEL